MREKVWYVGGLKFQCTHCGDCCTGDAGYVWVNEEEIAEGLKVVERQLTDRTVRTGRID